MNLRFTTYQPGITYYINKDNININILKTSIQCIYPLSMFPSPQTNTKTKFKNKSKNIKHSFINIIKDLYMNKRAFYRMLYEKVHHRNYYLSVLNGRYDVIIDIYENDYDNTNNICISKTIDEDNEFDSDRLGMFTYRPRRRQYNDLSCDIKSFKLVIPLFIITFN